MGIPAGRGPTTGVSRTLSTSLHTHSRIHTDTSIRVKRRERCRGVEKPRRKRNGKQGKKERGSASVDAFSSSTWGTKKLSYNCCTPRAAPPVPPSNCNLLPHRTGRIATTTRNVRVSCVLDRPPCRLTSSGCLLWPTATEITVITRIYEGLRQPSNGLPMPWSASAARSTSTDTRFPRYSKDL